MKFLVLFIKFLLFFWFSSLEMTKRLQSFAANIKILRLRSCRNFPYAFLLKIPAIMPAYFYGCFLFLSTAVSCYLRGNSSYLLHSRFKNVE